MSQKMVKPGDRVILSILSNEVFEGTVECVSNKSIEIYNIYCQTSNVNYEGSMTFYRNEVQSISHLTDTSPSEESEASGSAFETNKKIKLHPDEFARLKEMYLQFIFFDIKNTEYRKAVEILSNRESVAVVGLGNYFRRDKQLSLLVIADFKQVYIFDIYCLKELRDLQEILESEFIVKVVHDGTALYDSLYHKYGIEMNNIYDTQIVDSMLEKKETNKNVERNISECLAHHFNFPLALLSAAVDDMHDKMWQERPVIKSNKIKAAQLVTYLLTLRDYLMRKILQEFNDTIEQTYVKYKHMSDMELENQNMVFKGTKK